jgi:regulator of replication initiation timing
MDKPDIVIALREGIEPFIGITEAEAVMAMAADEIERLKRERIEASDYRIELTRENERLREALDEIETMARRATRHHLTHKGDQKDAV